MFHLSEKKQAPYIGHCSQIGAHIKATGEFVKTDSWAHSQSLGFRKAGDGPTNVHSNKCPVTKAAGSRPHFKNHYCSAIRDSSHLSHCD